MINKVILPIMDDNLTIDYYVDSEGNRYSNFYELLNIDDEIQLFFHYYNLVIQNFIEWCKVNDVILKTQERQAIYTGNPSYDFMTVLIHKGGINGDPMIEKTRGNIKGHKFRFFNIKNFKRNITDFNITEADLKDHQKFIDYFIQEIVPQCKFKAMPNSIASASRKILPDPYTFDNPKKRSMLIETQSSRIGGLYYAKKTGEVYKVLYDYDVSSMYPFQLLDKLYPDFSDVPLEVNRFVEIKQGKELALYHVIGIHAKLKRKHFATLWTQKEFRERMNRYGTCCDEVIDCWDIDPIDGWITSTDYEMLKRDYDIKQFIVDKTYLYCILVKGDKYFGKLKQFYDKKQASTGTIRELYKIIIDSYSGSLAMRNFSTRRLNGLNDKKYDFYKPKDTQTPADIYAFMTAYARQYISDLAMKAGYDKVVSIDTDGIFAKDRTLDAYCGEGLGKLRLDKIMYNARWFGQKQYEYQDESGEWIPTIAGLPAYLYQHGKTEYVVPKLLFNKKTFKYEKKNTIFKIGEVI